MAAKEELAPVEYNDPKVHSIKAISMKKPDSSLKSLLAGGVGGEWTLSLFLSLLDSTFVSIAGMCSVLTGYPLDLVKVRMQTTGAGGGNMIGIMRHVIKTDGIAGFYRGVSAPLVSTLPIGSLSFWGFDTGKRLVRSWTGQQDLTVAQLCLASILSSLATTTVMVPSERIKVLMQTQVSSSAAAAAGDRTAATTRYGSSWDCARHLYRQGGIRTFYKGTFATLLRDVPGFMAFFVVYDLVKDGLMRLQGIDPHKASLSPISIMTAGGMGGVVCWTVMMPADTLKSRFQSAPEGTYRGLYHVYQELVRNEGHGALFKGLRPALLRAFPANAACFMGMEVAKQVLSFLD